MKNLFYICLLFLTTNIINADYYQLGDFKAAANYFEKSCKISPYHIGTIENYMITLAKLNNFEEAAVLMDKSNIVYPNYYNINLTMSKLYLQNDQYNEAKIILYDISNKIKIGKKIPSKIKKETRQLLNYIKENYK